MTINNSINNNNNLPTAESRTLIYNNPIPTVKDRDDFIICIPIIPDIHILVEEPVNRNGIMIDRGLQIFDEIIELVKINKCSGVIFTGDITDRGFNKGELNYESKIVNKIAELSSVVGGQCYSVLGNHEVTYAKNNLFYTVAHIDSDIIVEQIKNKIVPSLIYPYIHTPNCIDYGDLKIHLLHFQTANKKYKVLSDGARYNIGIYHDDLISFESKMELYHHQLGNGIDVLNTDIFENVDWAILGHIHKPLNTFTLDNVRKTIIDTPGSLISRTVAEKHEKVKIPFICVNGTGCYQRYVEFNIGGYDETINDEVVTEQRQKREMVKLLKKERVRTDWAGYESYISSIVDIEVRELIAKSDNKINLKSEDLINEYTKNANTKGDA